MSGDVQPRKRKDKKRRKDETDQEPIKSSPPPLISITPNDDQNIHIHKEGGTGGGICAKLVFFILFSALSILIGLIITEHRGLTDVEVVEKDSKFAQIFEGWTDSPSEHLDHDIHDAYGHDDHDEHDEHDLAEDEDEHEEEDEEIDHDEEESNEEDNELTEEVSEEDKDDTEEDEDVEATAEDEDMSEERDEEDEEDDDSDTYELPSVKRKRDVEEEDEDEEESKEKESEENLDDDDDQYGQDDDDDDDDDEKAKEDEDDDDDDYYERDRLVKDRSSEDTKLSEEDNEADDDQQDDNEDAENEEVEVTKREASETESKIEPDDDVQQSSGMAVKLGVGVALLVVAHLVLVRKWRTAPEDKPPPRDQQKEATPDLTRRNTIVMPPSFQEVEPDIEQEDEEYSDEEVSDEEVRSEPRTAKQRYVELRTTYSRSFSPNADGNRQSAGGYEDEEDEEEISEEEEDEEVEDEELLDEEESENEEYEEEDENEELLKRLEARYGKLPADKKPVDSHSSKEATASYEHANITSKDDFEIKEDIDEAEKFAENNPAYAVQLFDKILEKYPSSPRSLYGKAVALDNLADQKRSNDILYKALNLYTQLLMTDNIPEALVKIISERCIKRMRFDNTGNSLKYRKTSSKNFRMIQNIEMIWLSLT